MSSSPWFQRTPANSEEYFRRVYGDANNNNYSQLFDPPKFVTDREYFGEFGYGKCYNDSIESSVQCELISDDSNDFNPETLPYNKRIQWHLKEFSYKTSAHGLPQIGQAPNRYYRCIWIALVILCVSSLVFNAHSVLNKYNRNEKIVDIQLKFDTAPFPAITICNLNPYRASVAKKVELIRKTLSAFDDAMNRAGVKDSTRSLRIKRLVKEAIHEAPYNPPLEEEEEYEGEDDEEALFQEAMGFEGMSDEVAIVTKAKEHVMFAVTALTMEERLRLSHTKHDLVHKCSFGGVACDIEKDFLTHVDPIFGSCFTFNHQRNETLSSIKAGPMYGLRMLVYVNASEYLPTTEAAGIRITIHDKDDYPFPDTFGYSAPTGFISSFGLKLRKMSRLPAPYGDCLTDGKTEGMNEEYIYDREYSVEGCYRSCFQHSVLKDCQCGDPRFPVTGTDRHCEAADAEARRCLDERMSKLGGHQAGLGGSAAAKQGICKCRQPCQESIYSVTYSPARWPSQSLQIQLGACNATPAECTRHYQENGAMIEVFYEQLNFEMLTESEAYGFVNLLADFGGQMGLWVGMSFLTCCEIIFLLVETIIMSTKMYLQQKRSGSSSIDTSNQKTTAAPSSSKATKKSSHKSKYES